MHKVLLVRDPSHQQLLAELASRVFQLLGLNKVEERESSNYVDGHYFVAYAESVAVKVCHSDDEQMAEYPFWVVLQSLTLRKDTMPRIDEAPESVAKILAAGGLNVFVPGPGWGKIDWVPVGTTHSA